MNKIVMTKFTLHYLVKNKLISIIISSSRLGYVYLTRKGPAQARVSMDILHDGLRRETCSDTHITLALYPIILVVHSVYFANFLRGINAAV